MSLRVLVQYCHTRPVKVTDESYAHGIVGHVSDEHAQEGGVLLSVA